MDQMPNRLEIPAISLICVALIALVATLPLSCGGSREPLNRFGGPNAKSKIDGNGGAGATSHPKASGTSGPNVNSGGTMSATAAGTTENLPSNGGATLASSPWEGTAGTLTKLVPAWDYNGIVGTGQSLAVGNSPVLTTKSLYNNLMLSLGSASVPPWDPELAELALVPLVERKNQLSFPAPYPRNLWGETPHSAMANQITAMVHYASAGDYVTVHSIVGESGQGIAYLQKQSGDTTGTLGRAYAATLFEAAAIQRLAAAAGKTYGIAAIVMTHGETDSGDSGYRSQLMKLLSDYNADLAKITGQTTPIPMLLSQQFAFPNSPGMRPEATLTQWKIGVERPGEFICTGPKYQYPGHGDGTHLASVGYQMLGEKTGQVYYERILLGRDWQPLQPLAVSRDGRVLSVVFHVPVPPLVWDEELPLPDAWPNGRGFEVRQGDVDIAISDVEIVGDTVRITCASDLPEKNLMVGYAMTSCNAQMATASRAWRWGQLRDSDPFVGSTTGTRQPNYCVSFEMPVP